MSKIHIVAWGNNCFLINGDELVVRIFIKLIFFLRDLIA